MFGLEVVGAVAARDDANARELLARVEQLAGTISDVFTVLKDIFAQSEKDQEFTDAEKIIWKRMEYILLLCKEQLEELHQQLDVVAAKTEGFIDRTKEAAKLSILVPVIKRTKDDINQYFNALNLLKGLLQM
jgi:DNA phosphorothioation-dependent restriction protein DptG